MPDQYTPQGGGPPGGDPDRGNPTKQWRPGEGVDPHEATMAAPIGWSPSGGMPPQQPPQPPQPQPQPPPSGWNTPPPQSPGWAPGAPGWSPSQSYGWSPSQPGGTGWPTNPPGGTGWPTSPPGAPWGPPPGGGKPTGKIIGGIAVALTVVIGLVVGVVLATKRSGNDDDASSHLADASTTTSALEPTVSVTALEGLLPTASTVDTALHISGLEIKDTRQAVYVLEADDRVSDMDCVSVPYVSQGAVYEGSGYTAIRARRMEKKDVIIDTAAATFPTSQDATDFREKITGQWQGCARKPLTRYFSYNDDEETWMIGSTETDQDTAHTVAYEEGGEGWACTHAIGSRGNAALEALVCGNGMTDEAATLLNSMLNSVAG